jgi:hypothetical protein
MVSGVTAGRGRRWEGDAEVICLGGAVVGWVLPWGLAVFGAGVRREFWLLLLEFVGAAFETRQLVFAVWTFEPLV